MKEVTLKIPDKNFPFFMELIKKLGFIEMESKDIDVPEHHKKIIDKRLKALKKEDLLDWNKVKDDFNMD